MNILLLPCPFCGGKAAAHERHVCTGDGPGWYVACENHREWDSPCGIVGYGWCADDNGGQFDTIEQAVAAWNRRAPAAKSVPGPWVFFKAEGGRAEIQGADGEWILRDNDYDGQQIDDDQVPRIIACVNALDGFNPEAARAALLLFKLIPAMLMEAQDYGSKCERATYQELAAHRKLVEDTMKEVEGICTALKSQ